MKPVETKRLLATSYILLCGISAVFYIVADFGKLITKYYGIGLFCLLPLSILAYKRRKPAHSGIVTLFIVILQIVPAANWLLWSGASFSLLYSTFEIGFAGFFYHVFIMAIGAVLFIKQRKATPNYL
jgi:hypothetical protein